MTAAAKKAFGAIRVGSVVRQNAPPPPDMVVIDVSVDQEKLRADPANPVIVALCQWEEPEQEAGMGPHVVTRGFSFDQLEHLEEPPPQVFADGSSPSTAPSPKAHAGPREDKPKK